jgi:CrcB protein
MRLLLLAAAGGALGSGARHLVNVAAFRWLGAGFPWATLVVNVVGSLLMGAVLEAILLRRIAGPEARTFLATGILGGFTTFSAFSHDTASLLERGAHSMAIGYVLASVLLSLVALYLGIALARLLFS